VKKKENKKEIKKGSFVYNLFKKFFRTTENKFLLKQKKHDADKNKLIKILYERDAAIKAKDKNIQELSKTVDTYKLIDRPKWNINKNERKKLGFFEKRSLKRHPEISYFVGMTFPNGTYKEYIVLGKRPSFNLLGRTFLMDTKEALFDLTQNQYRLQYHFNECMPLHKEVRPTVKEGNEVWLTVKSDNAKPIFQQEYVRNVASANEISKYFIVNLVLSGFNLILSFILCFVVFLLSRSLSHLVKAVGGG